MTHILEFIFTDQGKAGLAILLSIIVTWWLCDILYK